ncbi:hypothetical protein J4573_48010 [Actinomadura barringtoniae]|uniref:DUF6292 domain-containing protein n=1 Tax=Actinomadura barringtoniae TaxID=1427535 RepID=A0A939PUA3_9ACTN|nr:DUF6292 family protein [Actinomadura barringtoniae]MBO2454906.1 hypothetical protein [Actinomadura barringtoniae]
MPESQHPSRHPVPEVNLVHGYTTAVVDALIASGFGVHRSWLDPMNPIDATVILGRDALVWDEWTGWNMGEFVSGRQGERTVLREARSISASVLVEPRHLVQLIVGGVQSPMPRSHRAPDARDGLVDALHGYDVADRH